jgi:RHS repeat-associated protein
MQSVDDGFGNLVTVTYASLSDSTVYAKGSGAIFPAEDVQPVTPVVKQYIASDGAGGTYTVTEKYFSARNSLWGRGFLGFAHREETDLRTGFEKVHQWNFHQDFPFIGQVSRDWIVQGTNPAGTLITNTDYDYDYLQFGSYPFRWHPFIRKSTRTTYEVGGPLNGQAITEVTSATDSMGTFGNPLSVTIKTKDMQPGSLWQNQVFQRVTTSSDVLNDQNNWCVGRPRLVTTTDTLPDGTTRTRTAGRTIDAAMCRTTDEVSEPSNNPLRVNTHYGFDGCGNVNQVDVTGRNPDGTAMVTRSTTLNYSYYTDRCVSPEKITNALSQIAFRTYRYDLGTIASSTDPNGLSTSWLYDGIGRRTHEQRADNTATDWLISGCTSANNYCGTGDATIRSQVQKVERDIRGSDIGSVIAVYDGRDRERRTGKQMSGGVWSYVSRSYDSLGRLTTQSLPYSQVFNGKHRFTYDLADRPIKDELLNAANAVDRFTSWTYAGRTRTITDPKTNAGIHSGATSKVFDAEGQLRRVIDPAPGGTTYYDYTYDTSGNQVLTIRDTANNISSMKIDPLGRKTSSDDVDMGHWTYDYNSLGEQVSQTDARSQSVSMTYDPLGRLTTRNEPEGQTVWTWGTSAAAHNIGQLEKVTSPGDPTVPGDQYKEEYLYDVSGRTQTVTYTQGGTYSVDYGYSDQGHLETVTYPTSTSGYRLKVRYLYSNGQLMQVKDANAGTVFWTLNAIDDAGRAIDVSLGNGLRQISGYDALTGTMMYRQSGSGGSISNLQNLSFEWDQNGNMRLRRNQNQTPTLTENFYYDPLNRLDYSQLNNITNLDVTVDAIGNLTYKSDVGNLDYATAQGACSYTGLTAQPHAVRNAAGTSYCYDANGNMTVRGTGNSVQWTSYNLPKQITQGATSSQFLYGANRNRWKQLATYSGQTETTIYIAGLMEKVTVPSGTAYRHYITFGSEAAVYTRWDTGITQISYVTQDHLSSTSSITDGNGAGVVTESFDAYGQRRNGATWNGAPPSADLASISNVMRRGFTGHEHLDNLNLIHMNGRVYSPGLGRFMSADPFVPDATDPQSLNRYTYVRNNPLTFTDPSGYIIFIEHCTPKPPSADVEHGPPDDPNTVKVTANFVPTCTYDIIPDLEPLVPMPTLGLPTLTYEDIKTLVITAWTAKQAGGVAVRNNLAFPKEQLWELLPVGEFVLVPTKSTKQQCAGGKEAGKNGPADPNFTLSGDLAALHNHPSSWALPFPGPGDALNAKYYGIPNFGMSPYGVWVIKPGDKLSVELVAGDWGTGPPPDNVKFDVSSYTKAINNPATGGKADPTCKDVK